MAQAAKAGKVKTFVWFNYRRVPAVALSHQLIKAGKLGTIRHVRASYLQDWAGENVPLLWRFEKELAGSGAHGDLNAHIVDMTRFVTGQEITEVVGAIAETFIKERTFPPAWPPAESPRAAKARRPRAKSPWTTPCCSSPASPAAPSPASRPPGRPRATKIATASRSMGRRVR